MPARILLVEDNPANLELMGYLLRAHGYDPRTAADGAAGLAAAAADPPDLIVCDVQMPVLDGLEVARRLKADPFLARIPLVAVTALAMVGDRDRVLAAGFDGYVPKPIDPETFVARLEGFLGRGSRLIVPPAAAGPAGPAPAAARGTVLVVDNRPVNLDLARSLLAPHGYRVVTAAGMAEALARAREHPPDLILSDVCMDGPSGFDLLRAVKADARLRAVPFVFLTATRANDRDRADGLALGAARYLERPMDPAALLAEIESCLRPGVVAPPWPPS